MKNDSSELESLLAPYRFHLPEELIATHPTGERDKSRLLVVDRKTGNFQDRHFYEITEFVQPKDLFCFNNTGVSKRRTFMRRESGTRHEVFFLERSSDDSWSVLIKGMKRLKEGERLFPETAKNNSLLIPECFIFKRDPENRQKALLETHPPKIWQHEEDAEFFFASSGHVPLPPYIKRAADENDRLRYNTLYAEKAESTAAPTAGFHFTKNIFNEIQKTGGTIDFINLKIGYGTFAPLESDSFHLKKLHKEQYAISEKCALDINKRLKDNMQGRLCITGTTTLRAIESSLRKHGEVQSGQDSTDLFIYPPDRLTLRCDLFITNFHLPASSLFMLVCSVAERELMLEAYRYAIQNRYRFFSYGDAMLIL